jgi:glyoxylate/hydroxypyruvate reductase
LQSGKRNELEINSSPKIYHQLSIVIIFNNKDPKPWAEVLQEKLPEVRVEIYPDVKDKSAIDFALCWKPEKNVLSEFPNLKVAQSVGASADGILKTQQLSDKITVTRIVDRQLSTDMFEYLLTGVMNFLQNTNLYRQDKTLKNWQQKHYKTIKQTTICVLGLGEIGAYVAKRFSDLGFKTKGWARTEKQIENVATFYGEEGLKNALLDTDVLINLLPLTPEVENVLNYETLSKLNQNGYLINAARGEHLVEDDLIQVLDNQHLAGALLDVFRVEPLPQNHPFWTHEKIVMTPHVASLTNIRTASDGVVENYRLLQKNEALQNIVSLKKGY